MKAGPWWSTSAAVAVKALPGLQLCRCEATSASLSKRLSNLDFDRSWGRRPFAWGQRVWLLRIDGSAVTLEVPWRGNIFITGGVSPHLGKGSLHRQRSARPPAGSWLQKFRLRKARSPNLNLDPGTMSPYQHGESVRCTEWTGARDRPRSRPTYERRFNRAGRRPRGATNVTTGPRFTRDILTQGAGAAGELSSGAHDPGHPATSPTPSKEFHPLRATTTTTSSYARVGGTVGDIEGPARSSKAIPPSSKNELPREHGGSTFHLTLLALYLFRAPGELKTKPTQHSVRSCARIGIHSRYPVVPHRSGDFRRKERPASYGAVLQTLREKKRRDRGARRRQYFICGAGRPITRLGLRRRGAGGLPPASRTAPHTGAASAGTRSTKAAFRRPGRARFHDRDRRQIPPG